jgi:hypothetical protein
MNALRAGLARRLTIPASHAGEIRSPIPRALRSIPGVRPATSAGVRQGPAVASNRLDPSTVLVGYVFISPSAFAEDPSMSTSANKRRSQAKSRGIVRATALEYNGLAARKRQRSEWSVDAFYRLPRTRGVAASGCGKFAP